MGVMAPVAGAQGLAPDGPVPRPPERAAAALPAAPEPHLSAMHAPAVAPQTRPMARPAAMVRPARVTVLTGASLRPVARPVLPEARWDDRAGTDDWTRALMSAINGQRHDLSDIVPRDIAAWCPAYAAAPESARDAFWVGLISALAAHESRFDPSAQGGGGQWIGLLQIWPPTARHFGCEARTVADLMDPEANLACAARIMTATVRRDQAVALHDGRWRGVAADWGPMTQETKRADMAAWTRAQDYCQPQRAQVRPVARPAGLIPAAPDTVLRPLSRPWGRMAQSVPVPVGPRG